MVLVYGLGFVDVEQQRVALGKRDGECLPAWDDDGSYAVGQCEDHFLVIVFHVGENRIASRSTRVALVARGLAQLLPLGAVVRELPIALFDPELRRHSVARRGRDACPRGAVGQRSAVERPVVDVIDQLHADDGRMAVFSVFAVVDGDRVAFGESDGVADGLTAADDGTTPVT